MAITVTFGTVEYKEGGVLEIPVTFGENVSAPGSLFEFSNPSADAGDGTEGLEKYYVVGDNTAFELIIKAKLGKKGQFVLDVNESSVFKNSDRTWDTVTNAQPLAARTFAYNTNEPRLINYDIPPNYTPGETFDVILQYDVPSTISPLPPDSTSYGDWFIFEGAQLGTPNIYRKTTDTYPDLPIPDFATETGNADWVQTNLTTEEATIYLLRWEEVNENATGIFNMTIKPGAFRGPVS
ncbi:MAG: hypothetical protein OXL96_14025 [Candidatus Poribacteria bacterium]|nr:hypothetical protein [Candidatus Poribacteria bacterium]